ncbi:DUF4406 domain-containing protein [Carboxylicivirga sp. N1Y90]|uniref:DUF4406 domain-containing protein n=1 Tax=Carboxylicivirga fragile TaxID=3417571 RepID=UPI003D32E1B9|nr:DUF4406 domain-containing protein [Marinilabiliaceae bacterium N1Y90]
MVVYLSGIHDNTDENEILRLKIHLLNLGCTIITPEDKELEKHSWSENLRLRMNFLQSSSAIYMIPNWKESVMARIELTVAMDDSMPQCFSTEDIKELITTLDG